MTAKQIAKKLTASGIVFDGKTTINRDQVIVHVRYFEHDNNGHRYGTCNEKKTAKLARRIAAALGWHGMTWTGYGACRVVPPASPDMGNWNDPCSRWHY